jgi:hypothetical protein
VGVQTKTQGHMEETVIILCIPGDLKLSVLIQTLMYCEAQQYLQYVYTTFRSKKIPWEGKYSIT